MRRRFLALAVAVLVIGAGATYWATQGNDRRSARSASDPASNGPLQIENGVNYYTAVKPGQGVVFSEPALFNRSTNQVVLDRAVLLQSPVNISLGLSGSPLIGLPDRKFGSGVLDGHLSQKNQGPWEPMRGAIIEPNSKAGTNGLQGYSLIFPFNIQTAGIAWSTGVEIYYHVGTAKYVAKSNDLFVVCTVKTANCRDTYNGLHHSPATS